MFSEDFEIFKTCMDHTRIIYASIINCMCKQGCAEPCVVRYSMGGARGWDKPRVLWNPCTQRGSCEVIQGKWNFPGPVL